MFFTYVLQSTSNGHFYIGQTDDLPGRVERHNAGGCDATRGKGPWEVVWSRQFATRDEAVREELRLKRKKSRKYLEWLIAKARGDGSPDCG